MNVSLHKKIHNSYNIDYTNSYPHTILFGKDIQYCVDSEIVKVSPNVDNTINVNNLDVDVSELFKLLKSKSKKVLFVEFNESKLKVPDIGQVLENVSKFLCN